MSVERLKKLLAEWIAPSLPANPLVVNLVEHVGYLERQHKRDYHLQEAEKVARTQRDTEWWDMQKEQHQAVMAHYEASLKELAAMTTRREEDIVRWKLEHNAILEASNKTTLALKAIEKTVLRLTINSDGSARDLGKPYEGPPEYGYATTEKASTANAIQLMFNICGEKLSTTLKVEDPLAIALAWVIEHSHYVGHPITKFDIRNAQGELLSPDLPVKKLNLKNCDQVSVALKTHMGEG